MSLGGTNECKVSMGSMNKHGWYEQAWGGQMSVGGGTNEHEASRGDNKHKVSIGGMGGTNMAGAAVGLHALCSLSPSPHPPLQPFFLFFCII